MWWSGWFDSVAWPQQSRNYSHNVVKSLEVYCSNFQAIFGQFLGYSNVRTMWSGPDHADKHTAAAKTGCIAIVPLLRHFLSEELHPSLPLKRTCVKMQAPAKVIPNSRVKELGASDTEVKKEVETKGAEVEQISGNDDKEDDGEDKENGGPKDGALQ
ncbi:hypothetical protein BDK51DRAFT_33257 [Blyttiomyces helicus]|uniref:Uncharacterized protein n=1 Tax=Blyttiomyces helicus TaxID=388810 RepID=A0A4V1IRB4_9FUNG|nr:hypothetical protein BDK51DRAFT_33257 [Blyttiomyces helicus]|eukprot:RKO89467.1 hypothetical protein BDK51DRAFT_33257 [Blyttiomyces helicus]